MFEQNKNDKLIQKGENNKLTGKYVNIISIFLLPDIGLITLSVLDYNSLRNLYLTHNNVNLHASIKEIVKYKLKITNGFPRACGHCHTHFVGEINYREYRDDPEDKGFNLRTFKNLHLIRNLKSSSKKIVKGDLIVFNNKNHVYKRNEYVEIYNGSSAAELSIYCEYGCVPVLYSILKDDVPLNYWSSGLKSEKNSSSLCGNVMNKNRHVAWVDFTPFLEECTKNIQNDDMLIFTFFHHNNTKYTIHFTDSKHGGCYEGPYQKCIESLYNGVCVKILYIGGSDQILDVCVEK